MAKSATDRKAEQRAKLAASGGLRHELVLTQPETEALERNRQRRNPGRSAYSRNEYISLLILCDDQRLERQEKALGSCQRCGKVLPGGCNGDFKGEAACWFTRDCLSMNLTSAVTGHANLQGEG
ncbi:hypothetical protein [Serratia sp. JSRIV004]|uniref:hypothetical protein n=2 Tax=unclassified Serratia (in: enterobacteria) TaxID=2647522 RepID=UPI001CBC46EC|nr:hypothetical protein [Serratia sp. JSRIV004]UAN55465.1 hypothetical protein KGP21_17370 [Serratia sp. JSRIV004]UAN57278.1 hypothetical protein KGP21_27395 [Serratia sp. JSRIV004]